MPYIQDIACEALSAAHTDLVKARRVLLLATGLLALIHLLSVYPYLTTSREIADLEPQMASNAAILARLDPEIERLQMAEKSTGERLDNLLDNVTNEMIRRFAELRHLVEAALGGEVLDIGRPPAPYQWPTPEAQFPGAQSPLGQQMQQVPPSEIPGQSNASLPGESSGTRFTWPELRPILQALAAKEPDAGDRLIAYARRHIVVAAYARAQSAWSNDIRPDYLGALDATTVGARQAAEDATESAAETAAALRSAADELSGQRAAVETIVISHDNTVDEALGGDWWRTVGGKGAYAEAVKNSITSQMRLISDTAAAPAAGIRKILALQQGLRDELGARQEQLEKRFAEQRNQLSALSGTSGAIPVDLASFIGLFPLVLGVVLGLLLLRAGQARREASLAAADLALAAPEDRELRAWLVRRALGGDALGALVVNTALALGAVLWIALAALQVADSPMTPPLAPWASGVLAALMVLAAAVWDATAIQRLAAELRR